MAAAMSRGTMRVVRNRVRGEAAAVPCAAVADVIVFAADTPEGRTTMLVRSKEVSIEPAGGADLTRAIARVRFDGSKIEELFDPAGLGALRDRARVLVAADAAGGAAKALEMAVAYAKEREQFDRPIGSFQAVKHRAADAWRAVEAARLAVWYAAWAIANGAEDATVAASAAKAIACEAFVKAAADSIQIHGGIGFTWEHDAHLYFKRAKSSEILLGDATYHRELLAQRIGI
jgi:alkylation response protein AidB-like acyl-CoA dehydrogenase